MARAFTIRPAQGPADLAAVADLMRDYWRTLAFDPGFQDFATELAGLPGKYVPPEGALLVAEGADGTVLGCIAMRPLNKDWVEMKRLYVTPAARGLGLGRALADAICDAARKAGYREIRLDTVPQLLAARAIYQAMGFETVPPYYENPPDGLLFFGKVL